MTKPVFRVGGVPEHFNLPWHLACEQDRFANSGVAVQFSESPGGTGQLTAALQEGELDIAVLLLEGAMRKILNGGSYRIVKLFTDTPLIWGIHVANNSPIQSVDECQGKRYAISRCGSGSHLIAIVDAAERGWPTAEMKFVKIGNLDGARKSLAIGESDVFLWEKFMTKPLVDNGELRRIGDRIVPWPAFVVAARNELLDNHAGAVGEVLQIVAETCLQLKQDPAAAHVIAGRYDLLPEDAQTWLDRTRWNCGFEFPETAIQKAVEYLKLLKLLDNPEADFRDAWFQLDSENVR